MVREGVAEERSSRIGVRSTVVKLPGFPNVGMVQARPSPCLAAPCWKAPLVPPITGVWATLPGSQACPCHACSLLLGMVSPLLISVSYHLPRWVYAAEEAIPAFQLRAKVCVSSFLRRDHIINEYLYQPKSYQSPALTRPSYYRACSTVVIWKYYIPQTLYRVAAP